jgi:hypothetical protein
MPAGDLAPIKSLSDMDWPCQVGTAAPAQVTRPGRDKTWACALPTRNCLHTDHPGHLHTPAGGASWSRRRQLVNTSRGTSGQWQVGGAASPDKAGRPIPEPWALSARPEARAAPPPPSRVLGARPRDTGRPHPARPPVQPPLPPERAGCPTAVPAQPTQAGEERCARPAERASQPGVAPGRPCAGKARARRRRSHP